VGYFGNFSGLEFLIRMGFELGVKALISMVAGESEKSRFIPNSIKNKIPRSNSEEVLV